VVVARLGRKELGETTVTIDEDSLNVAGRDASGERAASVRVPLASVDGVVLSEGEIVVRLRDGRSITFVAQVAPELREHILGRCRVLPELTHALRAFGSRRGHRSTRSTAASDQTRFFAPLLDARREAVRAGTASAAMAAFDADALAAAFESELRSFAAERYADHPPARRALEAELTDLAEPLRTALDALRDAATNAAAEVDDLRLWRAWAGQLGATFETADRVWLSLDVALDSSPWKL
jgi:hypothetical protein